MTEPGTVINIVCSDRCPGKLLSQVVFLIGNLCRAKNAYGVRAGFRFYFTQSLGHQRKGLIPGCLSELTVFLDKGNGESFGLIDKVVSKTTLSAEAAKIRWNTFCTGYLDDLVIPYM
ncbi:hypothetical protein ES703_116817 [subsurface metagenome]